MINKKLIEELGFVPVYCHGCKNNPEGVRNAMTQYLGDEHKNDFDKGGIDLTDSSNMFYVKSDGSLGIVNEDNSKADARFVKHFYQRVYPLDSDEIQTIRIYLLRNKNGEFQDCIEDYYSEYEIRSMTPNDLLLYQHTNDNIIITSYYAVVHIIKEFIWSKVISPKNVVLITDDETEHKFDEVCNTDIDLFHYFRIIFP